MSTLGILDNINITRETTYGKNVTHASSDTRTKSGTETTTLNGEEITEESFPTSRKSKRTISGGWQDSGSTSNTRRGTEETTETYPVALQVSKTIEGGYSDSDTTAITRTGTETTTESFPISRQSSKVTTGGYSDTTSSSNVRSGGELTRHPERLRNQYTDLIPVPRFLVRLRRLIPVQAKLIIILLILVAVRLPGHIPICLKL